MIYGFLFFIFVISIFIIFDYLLRKEYRENYDLWLKDGKPFGMFWVPKESRGFFFTKFKSQRSRDKLLYLWFFQTPKWLKDDNKSINLVWIYRICALGALISWLLGVKEMFFK